MLSCIHEILINRVTDSIKNQLINISTTSNEPTKRLIQDIEALGCSNIVLYGSGKFRSPDGQFAVADSYYPGVVIEIAYSQSFQSLRWKAQDLIVNSSGNIQLVIGLEVESNKAYKISAWRPDFIRFENQDTVRMRAVIEQDVIRDNDGNLKSGSLTFQLRDFANNLATTFPDAKLNEVITLHYGDLTNYLARAEKFQAQK